MGKNAQLSLDRPEPSKIIRRGGNGPEQPVYDDCGTYTAEWYRRFRDWHGERFPDVDAGTRSNLGMLVATAESRDYPESAE